MFYIIILFIIFFLYLYIKSKRNNYVIIRILGNDISTLHNENQTFDNLKFTLENEPEFKNTDKIYILNKIIDNNKKNKIIKLLKKYKTKYLEITFNYNEYIELNKKHNIDDILHNDININIGFKQFKKIMKRLKDYNLFIINNNGARNYALQYGKKYYEWSFILDSNNMMTQEMFDNINLDKRNESYIILPQKRIGDNVTYVNETIFDKEKISLLPIQEPQIVFHKNSKLKFNPEIPYGSSPKAELLRVIGVPGVWSNWKDNNVIYNIKDRDISIYNEKHIVISHIVRLSPYNQNNNRKKNYRNRILGLITLIEKLNNKYIIR